MVLAARTHVLAPDPPHYVWDNSLAPRLVVQSGDSVTFETRDASDGHFGPGATASALQTYEFRGHPLTGPVLVEGARAGDVVQVDVLEVRPAAHGWTAILPGFGLLPEDFPDPYLRTWDLSDGAQAALGDSIGVPLDPREYRLTRQDAYCLASVAVDLKISQVVDAPNWIVSAFLPMEIFTRG
jgi:acetamidase/formamidase